MNLLTLTASLPRDLLGTATATDADYLIVQKSGEDFVRRLAGGPSSVGAAAENGSLTESFSASDFLLPDSGSVWAAGNQTGMTVNGTANVVTLWAATLRVRDNTTAGDDYALVRAGSLDILNAADAVTASISSAGAFAGVSFAASGAVSGATVSATGAISGASVAVTGALSGASATVTGTLTGGGLYLGTGGIADADTYRFASDTDCKIARTSADHVTHTVGNTTIMELTSAQVTTRDVVPLADDSYRLGGTSLRWIDVWAVDGSINTSDARAKADITDCPLGMDFISALRPVSYRWQDKLVRVDIDPESGKKADVRGPGVRRHYGLLAQQVEDALGGRDFAGYIHDEATDVYALRYHEFIAPLIKALQEEHAARLALEDRLAAIESIISG